MMSFSEKIRLRMAARGIDYRTACRELGAAGGRKAAANKVRAHARAEKFHGEQRRQAAMGLRGADELPDSPMTSQDVVSIALDQRRRVS